ncbi:hypothetical protein RHECNPAF_2330022 [Rhizobium etli CNPAF512]|nr:hypothetical protein RHECNPAF_2330022 [Rhizobium etli CNPAF512]
MKSEAPLGISSTAAMPIACFSEAAIWRRASYLTFSVPLGNVAPPWMRVSTWASQRSLRSLRMVCGVTEKREASSSTRTLPLDFAIATISVCRSVKNIGAPFDLLSFLKKAKGGAMPNCRRPGFRAPTDGGRAVQSAFPHEVDHEDAEDRHDAADRAQCRRHFAEPDETDQGCNWRHAVKEIRGATCRQPLQRDCPGEIADRGREDDQIGNAPIDFGGSCRQRADGRRYGWKERHGADQQDPGRDGKRRQPAEQRLLQHAGDRRAERRAEDEDCIRIELETAVGGDCDQCHAAEGNRGARPAPAAEAFAEREGGDESGKDRHGIDDEAGRPRRNRLLAGVQQNRIGGDEEYGGNGEAQDVAFFGNRSIDGEVDEGDSTGGHIARRRQFDRRQRPEADADDHEGGGPEENSDDDRCKGHQIKPALLLRRNRCACCHAHYCLHWCLTKI